jgi:uncharacterized RDD family membrane protein YckC
VNKFIEMQDNPPVQSIFSHVQAEPTALTENPKLVAGFWRRLLAFLIDVTLIGFVGLILGTIFFDTFASMGGWGRLVGYSIGLLYFGIANSSVGDGQTIGKKLLKLRVVSSNGELLSMGRSFLRYSILTIPYFLNGLILPTPDSISAQILLNLFLGLVVIGLGLSTVYLFIFNRKTRQSVHDLVTNTFVTSSGTIEPSLTQRIWRGHLIAIAIWILLVVCAPLTLFIVFRNSEFPTDALIAAQRNLEETGNLRSATVYVGKAWATGSNEISFVKANCILKTRPENHELLAAELASRLIDSYPEAASVDVIQVNLVYGFDIGIASGSTNYSESHAPNEWSRGAQEPPVGNSRIAN